MEIIKQLLLKIISGFLLGVGFVVAAGLLGGYAISYMTTTASHNANLDTEIDEKRVELNDLFKEYDETANLSVAVKTEKIGNGSFVLLGEIINSGEFSWQMINLQADLFNSNGQFIEQCTEYVSQTLHPGETANFKLSCKSNSCNTVDVSGYNSYTLKIADARYIRDRSND